MPGDSADHRLRQVAATRSRVAIGLTGVMIALYFGFILLIAYDKPLLSRLLMPGVSLGILLGALVIVLSWALTYGYVRWANTHYDAMLARLRE